LIGSWLWIKEGTINGYAWLRATDAGQIAIKFHETDGRVLELSGYAFEIEGTVYYVVTPDTGSYFRFYEGAKDVPGHMLSRVEFVNDDEAFVWVSMWNEASAPPGWSAKGHSLGGTTGGVMVDVSRDALRAALRDDPYRVMNFRIGPYYKVPSSRQSLDALDGTAWLIDDGSKCAVGFAGASSGFQGEVTWSGDCRDGRANGHGLLELKVKGAIEQRYEGTLVDGLRHGVGRCSNGKSSEWKTCQYEFGRGVKATK